MEKTIFEKIDTTPVIDLTRTFLIDARGELDRMYLGMTEFQIEHFLLNKREFTNDWAIWRQIKQEFYHRYHLLKGMEFDYRKTQAGIDILVEEISNVNSTAVRLLKEIEIEEKQYKLGVLEAQMLDKFIELKCLYKKYLEVEYIEELSKKERDKLERESWERKSAYYSELFERYNLTPLGFGKYAHELISHDEFQKLWKREVKKIEEGNGRKKVP